ncbi:hypothetical protein FKM82_029778, partial [Ascaphus truei]
NGASTVVTSVFGGVLQNEVNCLICGTESRKFDPFLDLSLDIPSQFRNKRCKNQENGPACTLRGMNTSLLLSGLFKPLGCAGGQLSPHAGHPRR